MSHTLKECRISHLREYGIQPFCNQLSFRFRDFFYGYNPGKWKSQLPCERLICILDDQEESFLSDTHETVRLRPGTMVLVPAFHEISHDQSETMHLLSIHFSLELYCGIEYFERCDRMYWEDGGTRIEKIKQMMVVPNRLQLTAAMNAVCWDFISSFIANSKFSEDYFSPAYSHYVPLFDYLLHNCHAGINVEQMAAVMHMNRKTFVRKFTCDNGIAPKLFFNRLLARKAAECLVSTDMTVSEIADRFGFCNEFYFSRFFKRHFCLSPREYRTRYRFSADGRVMAESFIK